MSTINLDDVSVRQLNKTDLDLLEEHKLTENYSVCENIDMEALSEVLRKLSCVLKPNGGNEHENKAGHLIQKAFLNSNKPLLPKFTSDDILSWFDIIEKRFADFGIEDSHQKYKLIIGLFSPEEQLKLAPYFLKGTQETQYDDLMEGVKKLFGLDELEIALKADNMQFDYTDLPSTFAHRVRLLLVSGKVPYHEQHIKNVVINRLPVTLVDQLAHYMDMDLDDLMQLADTFYTIGRSVRNRQKYKEQEQTIPTVGLEAKNVLGQILDTLKSLESQIKRLADARLQNRHFSEVSKNVPPISKAFNQGLSSPVQGNISNYYEIVENAGICKNHQIFGKRCHNCVPVCKWNDIVCCARHSRFAIKAHFCENPDLCQFKDAMKPCSN